MSTLQFSVDFVMDFQLMDDIFIMFYHHKDCFIL